jgi:hypothetical protein
MRGEPEVGGIGDVVSMQALTVQPLVAVGHAVQQPAIVHDRVVQGDVAAQPDLVLVLPVNHSLRERLLAIHIDAQQSLAHPAAPGNP